KKDRSGCRPDDGPFVQLARKEMHPILADRRRLLAYVAAWELLGGLLSALLVLSGNSAWPPALSLAVPLAAVYAFVCLGAFWACRAAPLGSGLLKVAGSQLAAAALPAARRLRARRLRGAPLESIRFFPGP